MRLLKLVFFLGVLSTLGLYSQDIPKNPVKVDIRLKSPSDASFLAIEIELDIHELVHVYTSEVDNFEVHESYSEGLGKTEILLPDTKTYKNFDGRMVDIINGKQIILVRKPYRGTSGEKWEFNGFFQYQACTEISCYKPAKVAFVFEGVVPPGHTDQAESEKKPFYMQGLFLGIIGSFLAGLALSLTPCVYPMIGITVAIIGSGAQSKKRTIFLTFVYVLGLSIVYALAGIIVASVGSAVSNFFRSAWVLIPIGVIFVLLGLSMFNIFTIQTPSSFAGKIQAVGGKLKGSVIGIFIMGALSAFVVGPCVTGPLLGLVGFVARTGELFRGFAYFFALAWGMGMILFIAGTFSGALPKAGVWMDRVKHVLGVVLIWAAFYFTRPLIGEAAFWTANIVALALGLNAAGLLRIPETGDKVKGLVPLLAGLIVLSGFVFYGIHDMQGARAGITEDKTVDLEKILAQSDKPVLLDFTAPWCSICKKIKITILSLPEVKEKLKEFTFIAVDFDSNPDLVQEYAVIGPPGFIFLNKSGKQIGKTIVIGEELKKKLFSFDREEYNKK